MRTTLDRIRHAISFEVIGLLIIIPLGTWVFAMPVHDAGVVAVVGATLATLWNYVYNLLFDHAHMWVFGHVHKKVLTRVAHAVLFELGLLIVLLPFIAWYLGVSIIEALILDIAFAVFYLVYAFVFNWLYDIVFPLPAQTTATATGR